LSRHTDYTFYIENLGCAKNQVDAEIMVRYLQDKGWSLADSPDNAAFIIVNSCGFIRPAKEESIDAVIDFRDRYPEKKIILAGCLAQRYGKALSGLNGTIDGIFGNRALSGIPEFLERLEAGGTVTFTGENREPAPERRRFFSLPGSVYVKISEGCNNRCSFCAIPLIRGALRSRRQEEIIWEIKNLLALGMFEINLIGQDLGSYGRDTGAGGITELLSAVSDISGDFWIRLLYIHPDHFPVDILDLCRRDPRILPYFDIPFQHASSRILARMGRRGSADDYLGLAGSIRSALPDAVIRTTFLVGFPGETREDFAALVRFQQALDPDWLGVFTYSREEGTPAATMRNLFPVRKKTAEGRREVLMTGQAARTTGRMKRFKGSLLPVLIEERVKGEDLALGRIFAQAPEVDGLTVVRSDKAVPGRIMNCRITGVNGYDLEARPELH